jgi:hypothetical protein
MDLYLHARTAADVKWSTAVKLPFGAVARPDRLPPAASVPRKTFVGARQCRLELQLVEREP